ncbi:hypothetical protein LY78DRAFT_8563 [Colletotrichum sublineola]|nr:hypothetical protein LY78DRAFT_8563 [Colletotrichum sublineola]
MLLTCPVPSNSIQVLVALICSHALNSMFLAVLIATCSKHSKVPVRWTGRRHCKPHVSAQCFSAVCFDLLAFSFNSSILQCLSFRSSGASRWPLMPERPRLEMERPERACPILHAQLLISQPSAIIPLVWPASS